MQRIAIKSLKALGWLLLASLLLALAWLASNNRWVDVRNDAVPHALQLPASTLPAERNDYFTLLGLTAPSGENPNRSGQRRWEHGGRDPEPVQMLRWPEPMGSDAASNWVCRFDKDDCVARWHEQSAALRGLLRAHALIGDRCESLADGPLMLEEPIAVPTPEIRTPADQYLARATPQLTNWVQCGRWLRIKAVLAQESGDSAALRLALRRSQNYTLGLLSNARTLSGSLLSWHVAAEHWQMFAALAARQPVLAPEMIQSLERLPEQALDASRWMAQEAYDGRQINYELGLSCRSGGLAPVGLGPVDRVITCSDFGFMPHATQQLFDQYWLQGIEQARGGPLALLDWSPRPQGFRVFGLSWHNTVGHILADVGMPAFTAYGRRQADLLLVQQTALLALKAGMIEPAQRQAWLATQPLDERLRTRIRLVDRQLVASLWSAQSPATTVRFPIPPFKDF